MLISDSLTAAVVLIAWIFILSAVGAIGCLAGDLIDKWLAARDRKCR
jgi:hypothetical protein